MSQPRLIQSGDQHQDAEQIEDVDPYKYPYFDELRRTVVQIGIGRYVGCGCFVKFKHVDNRTGEGKDYMCMISAKHLFDEQRVSDASTIKVLRPTSFDWPITNDMVYIQLLTFGIS